MIERAGILPQNGRTGIEPQVYRCHETTREKNPAICLSRQRRDWNMRMVSRSAAQAHVSAIRRIACQAWNAHHPEVYPQVTGCLDPAKARNSAGIPLHHPAAEGITWRSAGVLSGTS